MPLQIVGLSAVMTTSNEIWGRTSKWMRGFAVGQGADLSSPATPFSGPRFSSPAVCLRT